MEEIDRAITATLCYSAVFDYPLTKAELWRYLSTKKKIPFTTFAKALQTNRFIKQKDGYFYLHGQEKMVSLRQKRKKISQQKILHAKKICRLLQLIPTIQFIGLSGSLSMENANKNADIDFFIIASYGTIWLTRLFIFLFLQSIGKRRRRDAIAAPNTVCVNMLIDTTHIEFPKNRQDMYTAHEIMQMKPLFIRNNIYEIFLQKNMWVKKYLFNSVSFSKKQKKIKSPKNHFFFLETLAKNVQLWYMKKHMTKEIIKTGFLAFHPNSYREYVLAKWIEQKKQYGI